MDGTYHNNKVILKLIPVKRNSSESEHAGSNRNVGYEVTELTIAHAEYPVTVDNQVKRCSIKYSLTF